MFSYSWEKLLLKIELSEITPFFYKNFFGFGGGNFSPPPLATPLTPWRVVRAPKEHLIFHLIPSIYVDNILEPSRGGGLNQSPWSPKDCQPQKPLLPTYEIDYLKFSIVTPKQPVETGMSLHTAETI